MLQFHVPRISVSGVVIVHQRLVPVTLRQIQRLPPQVIGDLPSLVMLADGVGAGGEQAVDRVLFVLLLLVHHRAVLPAGIAIVLRGDDLLPQGLHLLAGAPKIGKSWLALWLCLCAAQGKPLWTFATRPCEVLYLCLEDSFQRIQSRLFDLTEDAPPTLHFAVMSQQLHNGLVEQIEQFLKEHPQTRLIVIDTLQRIRTAGNDANPYASDYRDIGVLKALADKYRIAILLVHHLRKMNDDDPMNMISGTTGLSGATDSNFVLRKSKRRENTATLYCTGRDIPYRELALEFDGEDHVWKLLSDDCEQKEQPNERILFLLSELLRRQPEISAPAKVLLEKIDPAGAEGLTPNSFSHRIRKSVDALRRNGITVSFRKSNGDRLICLKRVDGVDDPATENIVTTDPENLPCFGV